MRSRPLNKLLLAALALCAFHRTANAQSAPCLDADLVARNGHIVTMATADAIVSAIAVRDGKIQAVGTDAQLSACASPRTNSSISTATPCSPA